jgi:uncharacterized repeat protein (TIGR01451 family)
VSHGHSSPRVWSIHRLVGVTGTLLLAASLHGAVLRVTSNADNGPGTLRAAITTAEANGQSDIIIIDTPGPIVLSSQLPPITTDITIVGSGQTVSGNDSARIFRVNGGNVTFSDLTLAHGKNVGDAGSDTPGKYVGLDYAGGAGGGGAGIGGALLVMGGSVRIADVVFSANNATGGGGGRKTAGQFGVGSPGGGFPSGHNANGWGLGGKGDSCAGTSRGCNGGDFSGGGGGHGSQIDPGDCDRPSVQCNAGYKGGNGGFGGGGGGGGGNAYNLISTASCSIDPTVGCCTGGAGGLHGGAGATGGNSCCGTVSRAGGGGAGLGGAIFVNDGMLVVTNSSFIGNSVLGGDAFGTNDGGEVAHAIYNRNDGALHNGAVNTGNIAYDNTTNHTFGPIGTTATAPQTSLAISVSDGLTTAIPGQPIVYTVNVSNSGPDGLSIAAVNDLFPAGLVNVTWTCTPSGGATCSASGTTLDDQVTLPSGGSLVYSINATISPSFGGILSNTATVTASGDSASATDTTHVVSPNLGITKAHSGTFTQGSAAIWTLQVANNAAGAADSTNGSMVTVTDTLPSGYTLSTGTGTGWTCGSVTNVVTCTSSDVVGASGGLFPLITLTVNVPAGSPPSVSNTANVFGGGDAAHATAGTAAVSNSDAVTVIQVPASITINGSATQTALVGTAFGSLAVTVRDAANLAIANYASAVFTAPASGPGGTFDNTSNTKSISTNAGGIADPGTFTANTIAGTYTMDVAAGPATHATFNLTNSAPDLILTKGNNVSNATTFGNHWTWTLTVSNIGNGPANFSNTQTILRDDLPDTNLNYSTATPTTFFNVTGSASISCGIATSALTCSATGPVSLAAAGSFQVIFTATPTAIGTFANPRGSGAAAVDPGDIVVESNESNNSASDSVIVTPGATTSIAVNQIATFGSSDQNVTLSATVTSPAIAVNEGTVTFAVFLGATEIGSPVTSSTVSSGNASVTFVLPGNTPAGTYTIVATYNPGSDFTGSSDNAHTLIVNPSGTTIAAANQTATFGSTNQNVTLWAVVNTTGGSGSVNEGTVTFGVFNGATQIGSSATSITVSGGSASAIFVLPGNTPAGSYSIVATYNAGTDYTGSTESTHTLNVGQAGTTITGSDQTATFGTNNQNVTLSATVSPTGGAGPVNEGTVTFGVFNGATEIGSATTSATVSGGAASATFVLPPNTPTGSYSIHATYNPGSDYTGSSDNTHTLSVSQAGTTIVAADQTATFGSSNQNVTLSAIVTATGGAGPVSEGTVTFGVFNGATQIGSTTSSTTVSSGNASATFVLPANTAAGSYSIHATYNPGSDYTSSSDNTRFLAVNQAATTTTGADQTATFGSSNQNVTLSATVSGGSGTVSEGTVTFAVFNGATEIGSSVPPTTVSGGNASAIFVLPGNTAAGSYSIHATYNPGSGYTGSTDNAHSLTVNAGGTTTIASDQTATFGSSNQNVTLSAVVGAAGGSGLVNEGTITFSVFNGPTQIGSSATSSTVTSGSASATYVMPANTAAGTYSIHATYNAGADYTGSTDNTHTLNVGQGGTTTTASNQTATFGSNNQNVTLSATVSVTGGAGSVNEGTVTFGVFNGPTQIGSAVTPATVSGGNASAIFALPANTPAGGYSIQATYNAGADYTGSADSSHSLIVGKAGTTTTATDQTATFASNSQNVTLSAAVTATGGAGSVNEGTITFGVFNGATEIGVAATSPAVSGGNATATYVLSANTPAGNYSIHATYNPGSNYTGSSDNTHTLTANQASTVIAASSQTAVLNLSNQNVVLSASVSSSLGSVNEGTVTFTVFNGATQIGGAATAATVSAGNASANYVLPGGIAKGIYTIVATYNPSAGYLASSDNAHTLTVTAPDLTLIKSDNVSNATTLGNQWTWTLHVTNAGDAPANFADTNILVVDNLPNAQIAYGSASLANQTSVAGTIACNIAANDLTCSASGAVAISPGGSFDIRFTATPSAIGTFANPRSGGAVSADPANVSAESNENNNAASDTVTVTAPDLTLTKTNDVTGATTLGNSWTWTLTAANVGNAAASFAAGQTILTDNLPNSNIGYLAASVTNPTNIGGTGSIQCAVAGSDLTCSANGGTVIIGAANGSFRVSLTATPIAIGTFTNPRGGGVAVLDPANVIVESIEGNNSASDAVVVTAPDLTISKSNNAPNPEVVGSLWTWMMHVANTGNAAATWSNGQTIVLDNLPNANLVYGTPSANVAGITCSINGTFDLSCAASGAFSLAANGSFDVQFTATPSAATTYTNPRGGGTTKVDPNNNVVESNESNNTAGDSVLVYSGADLAMTKSGPASAIAGDPGGFDYTLTVTNNGPLDSPGFTVTDTLENGLTFQSGANCVAVGQLVTCTSAASLADSATRNIAVHVTLAPSATGTLSNTASVAASAMPDPVSTNNTSSPATITTVVTQADLSITKSAPLTATGGTAFDYSINVANNGPSDNSGFEVTDTLPAGTTFQPSGSDTSCSATGQNVTCTIGTGLLNAATRAILIHVTVAPNVISGTVLNNTASVSSTGTIDPTNANDTSNPATATTVQTAADLSISKSAPATAIAGDPLGMSNTISVANNGPSDNAGGYTVTDVLPIGTSFVAAGSDPGCVANDQTVTCTEPALVNGANKQIAIHVSTASTVANGAVLSNTASVASNGTTDPDSGNNTSGSATTTIQTQADLSIIKSGSTTAIAGSPAGLNYTLTITNSGPSANTGGFSSIDALPAGLTFQTGGSDAGCSAIGQTVTCNSATALAVGAQRVVTIHATLSASAASETILHNNATVATAGTSDPNAANNGSNTLDTTVQASADLSVSKTAAVGVIAGNPLVYSITVTNSGPSAAQNVSLADVIPVDAVFASQSQTAGPAFTLSNSGQTVTDTIATLPVGATATFSISTNVKANPSVTTFANTATVNTSTTDPAATNDASTASTSIAVAPAVTAQPNPQVVCELQSVTFTAGASGVPAPTVQWQVSTNNGADFTNVSGATSLTLTFPSAATQNGYQYRAVFTNLASTATTNAVMLTVNTLPLVTSHPSTQAVCENASVTFTAAAIGSPVPTVQWQVSTDGGANYANIVSATSTSYTHTATSVENAYRYRAVFTNLCSTATTTAAILTVNTKPIIASQPFGQSVCAGTPVTLSVEATGSGLTYQWRRNLAPIIGATDSVFAIAAATQDDNGSYDAIVSGACQPAITSQAASLSVKQAFASVSGSKTICTGGSAPIQVLLSGTGPWTLIWSDDFHQTASSSLVTRTVTPSTTTTYAIQSVTDAGCGIGATAGSITITVSATPDAAIIAPAAICSGSAGNVASVAAGPSGTTYAWSATNATITNGSSTSAVVFAPNGSNDVTLTVTVTNPGSCSATSSMTVPVAATLPPPLISGPSSVKAGADLLLSATNGFATYQWLFDGTAISGATTSAYHVPSFGANNAGNYTVLATSGTCTSTVSAPFSVTLEAEVPTPENPTEQILAVIGSTSGANGSRFMTSLQMNNPGELPIEGTFQFFVNAANKAQSATQSSIDFTLAPHETRHYPDILGLAGFTGLATASLISRSGGVPISLLHIFNDQGSSGTTGLIERPILASSALAIGDTAVLIAPSEPASARFNIGVRALFMGLRVHGTVRDGDGKVKTTFDRTFSTSQFTQEAATSMTGLPGGPSDSITFEILSGSGVVYGASTDNITNDPNIQFATRVVALPSLPIGAGTRALLRNIIPVAGSTAGAFGSHFRTSVQLYNAGSITMPGSIVFHPSGRSGVNDDPSLPIAIAPQATLAFDDILASLKLSGIGSIDLFTAGTHVPVAVTRVYNDAVVAGQTSLTEELVAPERAIGAGHRAVILAPHDPSRARFNIGVRTLEGGATIKATVRTASGLLIGTTTLNYPGTWFEQVSATQQLGITFAGDESITYEVQSGAAILYGVWTDNTTQDPSLHFAVAQ